MSSGFSIQVYQNVVAGNKLTANNWGSFVEGLRFGTNAFGGYADCSFTLKLPVNQLVAIIVGLGLPQGVGSRLRVIDPYGVVCYQGMIYAVSLRMGNETMARGLDNMFNCVRVDYSVPGLRQNSNQRVFYDDAASRALYGKKVARVELPGSYGTTTPAPLGAARRFIKQHRKPREPEARVKGGEALDLALAVTCVGMVTPGLEWRYAYNAGNAEQVDTARVIKDMLGANPIAEGSANAHRGPSGSSWVEQLDTGKTLGYGQQYIATDFSNIKDSGTTIERNSGSGSPRIDIVKQAASAGSVNDRRMLFQVWENTTGNVEHEGKGLAYFREMSEVRPFQSGYRGYYDNAHVPEVFDKNQARIPLWRVRAGDWITTLGIVPNALAPTIYDDPRCFWIEETDFDVDTQTLTLSSTDEFSLEQYMGRLVGGKKVIKGSF